MERQTLNHRGHRSKWSFILGMLGTGDGYLVQLGGIGDTFLIGVKESLNVNHIECPLWRGQCSLHIKSPSCTCKSLERSTFLAHTKAPHVHESIWRGQCSLHIKGPLCTCKSLERATLLAHKRPLMYLQVFGKVNTPCT